MSAELSEKECEPTSSTPTPGSSREGVSDPVPKAVHKKIPLTEFVAGEWTVRNMLPTRPLPHCLNPNWVECDVKQLPIVWFGAPYEEDKVIPFAIANGFGDKCDPDDELYAASLTWVSLVNQFYKRFGIYLRIEEVWGLKDNLVLESRHAQDHKTSAPPCPEYVLGDGVRGRGHAVVAV
ncbi:hypothetical protein L226DRAFT_539312 [Lentinus tigrinus ALCF2SS1-7]|uniref:Uncharacterized protein n=1 Tax=Lentinus tigrinus ALCF2SS1-6 TaxID=1328759 RepID=A0A5C2RT72_9APHY|nr:hypothetical protein L227DRAFT_580361 [Lentinus tigrinus ALCF2SS1-6]RPD70062.1 hypothetical protein L226DRAFT_539312 [Lentinus tigrinus ALCF2SS1-7]